MSDVNDDTKPVIKRRRTAEEKAKAKEHPAVNPNEKLCDVWLPRKRRFCGFGKLSEKYCGHHGSERVPCTINPKHSVKKSDLNSHIKICSDRHMLPPTEQSYYKKEINKGTQPESSTPLDNDQQEKLLREVVQIVENYNLTETILTDILPWPPQSTVQGPSKSKSVKHESQIESLLGHMHKRGVLPSNDVFIGKGSTTDESKISEKLEAKNLPYDYIEFGAGKGTLACGVARVLYGDYDGEPGDGHRVYLIDKSNFRRKSLHPSFSRLQVDLQDFSISGIDSVKPVVGFSKHLCGVATDYTIQSYLQSPSNVHSLFVALCCHHRCEYNSYCNHDFLSSIGVDSSDKFTSLKKITSWTVDGNTESDQQHKKLLGRKAKRILDFGRILKLRDAGYKVSLTTFIDEETTPENCLMVATK